MTALLALASSLLWGTSDFLGGTASRRHPAVAVVVVSQSFGLVAALVVGLAAGALRAPATYLLWAVAAGLVGPLALVCFYRALATGTMGVVAPVASLGVVLPVAVGLVGGDQPHPGQLAGIGVAVLGVVLASGPELRGRDSAGLTPLLLAAAAAVGFGLALLFIARSAAGSPVTTLVAQRATTLAVLLPALAFARARLGLVSQAQVSQTHGRQRLGGLRPANLPLLAVIGCADVAANGSYAVASARPGALLAVVAVLASLYPVVTALLAWRVHDERLRPLQSAGVAAVIGGVCLIAAS